MDPGQRPPVPWKLVLLPDQKKIDILPIVLPEGAGFPEWSACSYESGLPNFTILPSITLDVLEDCQQSTGVAWNEIPLDKMCVYSAIRSMDIPKIKDVLSMCRFPSEGKNESMRSLLSIRDLHSLNRVMSLSHGTGVWSDNQEELLRSGTICPEQVKPILSEAVAPFNLTP